MKPSRRKQLAHKDDEYWSVDLGGIKRGALNSVSPASYAFPSKHAATTFAINHKHRGATVRNPYGRIVGEYGSVHA